MLMLMLCCGGCATSTQPAVIAVTPNGNAWAVRLQKGTGIFPITSQLKAVAVNEINEHGVTTRDLYLVSRGYLYERDARELNLIRRIEELELRKDFK